MVLWTLFGGSGVVQWLCLVAGLGTLFFPALLVIRWANRDEHKRTKRLLWGFGVIVMFVSAIFITALISAYVHQEL
jgi:hypothetical protein